MIYYMGRWAGGTLPADRNLPDGQSAQVYQDLFSRLLALYCQQAKDLF